MVYMHVLVHDICSAVLMFSFWLALVLRSLRPQARPLEYINTRATNAMYSCNHATAITCAAFV